MKNSSTKWLTCSLVLAALLMVALLQSSAAFTSDSIYLTEEPNEPEPECIGLIYLEDDPPEPEPESTGIIYLEDDPPEPEPECIGLIYLEDDPLEPEPESC
jgi:hypothetical protein